MELQSPEINEIVKALNLAQAELGGTEKDGNNPHFKSKYSTLQACISVTREPLAKNGLSITQQMLPSNGNSLLVTTLYHVSGQWIRSFCPLMPERLTSQGMGSSITYMRRYSLCALLGLYQSDDDGERAESEESKIAKNPTSKKPSVPFSPENQLFIEEQETLYGKVNFWSYVKAKGKKYELSDYEVVNLAASDPENFNKEIKAYIEMLKKK